MQLKKQKNNTQPKKSNKTKIKMELSNSILYN